MIELIIVYCLVSDAKTCVEKHVPMEDFSNPVACIKGAQQRAQEYLHDHPKYKLTSWRLRDRRAEADPGLTRPPVDCLNRATVSYLIHRARINYPCQLPEGGPMYDLAATMCRGGL